MVFEILEKKRSNTLGLKPIQVSIARSGTISFGSEIVEKFREKGFIEVFLDRDENKVGFKSSDNNFNGFKMQVTKGGKTTHIVSKVVKDLFPSGKFEACLEGEYVVINVPEIADNKVDTVKLK